MKKLLLAAAVLAIAAGPALAIDLNKNITQLNGHLLTDAAGNETIKKTVANAITNVLLTTEAQTPPADKAKRFWLADKVHKWAEEKTAPTFTPQELAEIEADLDKYESILVAGQVKREIDPSFAPPDSK